MLPQPNPDSQSEKTPSRPRARAFDLIAFDWDGTLFDSTAIITRCIQEAVRDLGDISLFEGVLAMLAELKSQHHWLAVATGKSRQGLDAALQAVELQGVFDASRTADETAGKPHPRMLFELMQEFGTPPSKVLMIGDTTHDLQMAVNAGCAGVGVSYGAHHPDAFAVLKPRFVAHSVLDLRDWLLANA